MSQHRPEPDGAFDRLRDADPAAGLEPDVASLDAAVRHRLGRPVDDLVPTSADDLAGRRAGRRPGRWTGRWTAIAAVAAGTLVAGSLGGYALGSRDGGGADTVAAEAITLPGSVGSAASPALGEESARVGAAQAPAAAADVATSSSLLPWFGGRTVFTASGLSDEPRTAQAWAYDPAQAFGAETAARVARSVGLEGEPRLEAGAWVVGAQDGRSASLQLQPDGVTSVSFYDPARDPFGCPPEQLLPAPGSGVEGTDGGVGEPGTARMSLPPCRTPDPGPAPTGDAAVARAREVLAAAGVDAGRYEYEVAESGTPNAVYVTAFEVVEGQRTGLVWNLTLVGDAVQSLHGGLAPVVPLGSYEVVSENRAVERLGDPRFGATGGYVMAAAESAGGAPEPAVAVAPADKTGGPLPEPEGEVAPPTPPATVPPGATIGWPVVEVELVSARLGLAQQTLPGGATVLLPAYELSDVDGNTWSVVAVADERLDFSAGR